MDDQGFDPDAFLAAKQAPVVPSAPEEKQAGATDSFNPDEFLDEKRTEQFGTVGQQIGAGIEGALQGIAGPIATGAELGLSKLGVPGLSAEEQAGREREFPITHGVAKAASMIGSAFIPVLGEYSIASQAGKIGGAAAEAANLGKIGSAAIKGAVDTGLIQGGDEISKAMLDQGDPNAPVAGALGNVGAASLFGTLFGTAFGTAAKVLNKVGADKAAAAVGKVIDDFGARANISKELPPAEEIISETMAARSLPNLKPDAHATMDAAQRLDLPVMNGMISGDKAVRMGEDALLNGPPISPPAARRQALYNKAHEGAIKAIDDVIPETRIDKNQIGASIQDALTSKISGEAEPFNELYSAIREITPTVPIKRGSAPAIARNIRNIEGVKDAFKSPAATLARDIAEELEGGNINNVEQLRVYQTELSGRISSTASSAEKRVLSIVRDKLDDWERRAISDHANGLIQGIESRTDMTPAEKTAIWGDKMDRLKGLQKQIDAADEQYAPFRKKLSELSSWLGKERVGGAKDAISFINDRLEPEDLVNKLSSKKYSGLVTFMQKNFPDEYDLVRQYEKSQLRQAASNAKEFKPDQLLKRFDSMPQAFKDAIFTPEEVQKLSDVKQYLKAMPENFNPSGTSHMEAFRDFFTSPARGALGVGRDIAIEELIIGKDMAPALQKAIGRPVSDAGAAAAVKVMSSGNPEGLWPALDYVTSVERGIKKINTGIDYLFKSGVSLPLAAPASEYAREKLREYVEKGSLNDEIEGYSPEPGWSKSAHPVPAFAEGGEVKPQASQEVSSQKPNPIAEHFPAQNMLIQSARGRINNYLNSIRPQPPMGRLPYDGKVNNSREKREYDKVLDMANQPLSIIHHIKDGSLTSKHMQHFKALYPELHNHLSQKIVEKITNNQLKDEKIPYKTRQALSMFLGSPLDSSMKPQNIRAAQAAFIRAKASAQQPAKGTAALGKASNAYKTSMQANEFRDQSHR